MHWFIYLAAIAAGGITLVTGLLAHEAGEAKGADRARSERIEDATQARKRTREEEQASAKREQEWFLQRRNPKDWPYFSDKMPDQGTFIRVYVPAGHIPEWGWHDGVMDVCSIHEDGKLYCAEQGLLDFLPGLRWQSDGERPTQESPEAPYVAEGESQ